MTSNGTHGSAMTGNTLPQAESLQWLGSEAPTSSAQGGQPPPQPARPPASTLASHPTRDPLLNPIGVSPVGVPPAVGGYRSDPQSGRNLYPGTGLLGPGYGGTTSSGSLSPYISSMYSHSGTHVVPPYSYIPPYYSHNTGSLLPYSVDNSAYSQILAHMQQPIRPSYLSAPYLQNSPGPVPRPLTPSTHLEQLRKSPKQEDRHGSPKDIKGHQLAAPHRVPKHHREAQDTKDPYQSSLHQGHYESPATTSKRASGLPSPTQRPFEDPRGPFARPQPPLKHQQHPDEPGSKRPRTISGGARDDPQTGSHVHGATGSQGPSATFTRPPVDPSEPHYPPHFMKGSIIQLANGELKRVEELRTEDFVHSADISDDLKIDSSTVVRIDENMERGTALLGFSVGEHRVQVTVEATLEHPFFVFGQGWSSCSPDRTLQRYGLGCHRLIVGDVCISLTHKDVSSAAQSAKGSSSDRPRGATDFSAARLLSSTPRSRDLSDYPRDLSLQRSQEAVPAAATTTRTVLQRRWSAPDQYSPPRSAVLSSTISSTSTITSVTSRSIGAPPSIGSAGSATTSSSRYSSPTRGHSPISVGRETAVTSGGPTSPP